MSSQKPTGPAGLGTVLAPAALLTLACDPAQAAPAAVQSSDETSVKSSNFQGLFGWGGSVCHSLISQGPGFQTGQHTMAW
jgi:hypothetical protein